MTLNNCQSPNDRLIWLALLLLVASGCHQLAPGISPISIDPPETAWYSKTQPTADEALDTNTSLDDTEAELASLQNGELLRAKDDAPNTYISRQYPRTYPAPPPPSTYSVQGNPPSLASPVGPQPPSSNQLPPGYQNPITTAPVYQPPRVTPLPNGGVPVAPPQAFPPPINAAPNQGVGSNLPLTSQLGDSGLSAPTDSTLFSDSVDPYAGVPSVPPGYIPNTRTADLEITGYPARTGRIMFGGAVNSDAGVTGQVTIDERNFDITRFPRSFQDLVSGTAFRGAGQTLRLEAVPGSQFKRYTASFADPNLFGYLPVSFGVSGFLYDRRYQDYDEERLGGRVSLGYRVTPELSLSTGLNGQNVEISRPRINTVQALNDVLGNNQLYSGEVRLTHDTRDSPFQPSEGHFLEFGYEKTFGDFNYSRFDVETRNYLLLARRADGSGKQTLSLSNRLGFSGDETPLFENYFAGGYSTMRGFDFRGAGPVESGVQVGGRFQWLNTLEYMFPITADDAFRGVAFVDFGTVERDIEINKENFRVAPGLGLRISIPMLGPAPLAFDFAYPVSKADTDNTRIFSFYMSALR